MEGGRSLRRHVKADNMRFSRRQPPLHFFLGKMKAAFVINGNFLAGYYALHGLQLFRPAEAVIGVSLLDQFFGVFQIKAGRLTLALYIGAYSSVLIRAFVMEQTGLLQSTVDDLYCSLHISFLICIFNSKNKISALMFGDQICVQCCTQISHMHSSRRTGRKSCSDLCHFSVSFPYFSALSGFILMFWQVNQLSLRRCTDMERLSVF